MENKNNNYSRDPGESGDLLRSNKRRLRGNSDERNDIARKYNEDLYITRGMK